VDITEVRIFPATGNGNFKAAASMTFDDCFVVKGLRIVEGKNGLFVSMPAKEWNENYYDVCFPITSDFRKKIQNRVLEEFDRAGERSG